MKEKAKSYYQGWYPEDPALKRELIQYLRARNNLIVEFRRAGMTLGQIAENVGLSRTYVKVIYHKKIDWGRKNYP